VKLYIHIGLSSVLLTIIGSPCSGRVQWIAWIRYWNMEVFEDLYFCDGVNPKMVLLSVFEVDERRKNP